MALDRFERNTQGLEERIVPLLTGEHFLEALNELEIAGVKFSVSGGLLHWEAPDGLVSERLRRTIEQRSRQLNVVVRLSAVSVNRWWGTRLHQASRAGDLPEMERLIANGAQPDTQNKYGHTAMHLAVGNGHLQAAELLLARGASLDLADLDGRTPLHVAVETGSLQMVAWLLSHGAAVNRGDHFGLTPLCAAKAAGKPQIEMVLQQHGALIVDPEVPAGDQRFLQFMLKVLAQYGQELKAHSVRVADISRWLANHVRLPFADCVEVRFGALLHDVGKMMLPDDIFNLADDEVSPQHQEVLMEHPIAGYDALGSDELNCPDGIRSVVLYHHEKWDGTGFPEGLKGADIPISAQIVGLADYYDHLVVERSYDPAVPPEQALEKLKSLAGTYFDPELVQAFGQVLDEIRVYGP
ncbi:MAG: ankyrin repeat domain-containing protein [Armatimonadetes bacterium]|nr:ankyrin repeat domain-containing protein [Armatimonadota bacterium]